MMLCGRLGRCGVRDEAQAKEGREVDVERSGGAPRGGTRLSTADGSSAGMS